jgi:hypothetical protein
MYLQSFDLGACKENPLLNEERGISKINFSDTLQAYVSVNTTV